MSTQGSTTDGTSAGSVVVHPLDPEDAAITTPMRAMVGSTKGMPRGIEARGTESRRRQSLRPCIIGLGGTEPTFDGATDLPVCFFCGAKGFAARRVTMLARVGNPPDQLKQPPGVTLAASGDATDNGDVCLPGRGGLPPRAFRRVREYILAHLEKNLSNRVLADLVGFSVWHFSRAFQRSAGVSPHRFVLQSRVDRVKHLLVETDLPLAQVAVAAGFADQTHCTRWFSKIVGIPPGKFRWLRG
jgi:AraC-like DNA-binding protein